MNRERMLLLTTTGARSGRGRTTPMMFHRDGHRLLVIASNVGAPRHPDWYVNLLAHPHVVVEVGDERFDAHAVPLAGADRERQWSMLKQAYPFFADHEAKTSREIPVGLANENEPRSGLIFGHGRGAHGRPARPGRRPRRALASD